MSDRAHARGRARGCSRRSLMVALAILVKGYIDVGDGFTPA